jgi:hypothetical protein
MTHSQDGREYGSEINSTYLHNMKSQNENHTRCCCPRQSASQLVFFLHLLNNLARLAHTHFPFIRTLEGIIFIWITSTHMSHIMINMSSTKGNGFLGSSAYVSTRFSHDIGQYYDMGSIDIGGVALNSGAGTHNVDIELSNTACMIKVCNALLLYRRSNVRELAYMEINLRHDGLFRELMLTPSIVWRVQDNPLVLCASNFCVGDGGCASEQVMTDDLDRISFLCIFLQ